MVAWLVAECLKKEKEITRCKIYCSMPVAIYWHLIDQFVVCFFFFFFMLIIISCVYIYATYNRKEKRVDKRKKIRELLILGNTILFEWYFSLATVGQNREI